MLWYATEHQHHGHQLGRKNIMSQLCFSLPLPHTKPHFQKNKTSLAMNMASIGIHCPISLPKHTSNGGVEPGQFAKVLEGLRALLPMIRCFPLRTGSLQVRGVRYPVVKSQLQRIHAVHSLRHLLLPGIPSSG